MSWRPLPTVTIPCKKIVTLVTRRFISGVVDERLTADADGVVIVAGVAKPVPNPVLAGVVQPEPRIRIFRSIHLEPDETLGSIVIGYSCELAI